MTWDEVTEKLQNMDIYSDEAYIYYYWVKFSL